MTRRGLLASILVALHGCFLSSDPFVAPGPAEEPTLEARVLADTSDAAAVVRLSVLWMDQGRIDEARTLLSRAEPHSPGDPAIPLLLAVAQERSGNVLAASGAYDRYRGSRTGVLAVRAGERRAAVTAAVTRARARALLAATPAATPPTGAPVIAVLPTARTATDEAAAAEAAAVSSLVGRDLAANGWRVVDDALVRTLLDEMDVDPTTLAELALGVEVGRRLGASHVVQATARRVSLSSTEWDITVIGLGNASTLALQHYALRAAVDAPVAVQRRMAALVRGALGGDVGYDPLGDAITQSSVALSRFGAGLRAMDRGEVEAAHAAFTAAAAADTTFAEAARLAARMESVLRAPPLDSLVREVARVGELQRAVLALRTMPGAAHQDALARVGASERPLVSDLLGLDNIAGDVLLDVTFTLPAGGP